MTAALTWEKQGETLALNGELDRDTLLSFWNARQQQMSAADGGCFPVSVMWILPGWPCWSVCGESARKRRLCYPGKR